MRKLTIFNFFWIILLLLIFSFSVQSVQVAERNLQGYQQQTAKPYKGISQRRAIAIAQQHINGRVLDIKQQDNVYRVKILSEKGSIHIVQVNVLDGRIITGH
ncbi:MAG: PepSY domain-containing protein [Nitrosomonas sp.]|nr:PepSY domain-containing protein [Nitrosomonas sp.]